MAEKSGRFQIIVPLDASGIKGLRPDRGLKVVAFSRSGETVGSTVAQLDSRGAGQATLAFAEHPGGIRVVVGPDNASDEDLKHLQTLSVNVAPNQLKAGETANLAAIVISPYYWWWWLSWCRDYTITGRLVCADGSPVPGATVCAYDVDWWWWWSSESQVGCAVTGADGSFQISFRRCCGWFWWWWWEQRIWRVNESLAERIVPLLQKVPGVRQVPLPDPAPDLQVFQSLLVQTGQSQRLTLGAQPRQITVGRSINPGALEGLRTQLLAVLPAPPEFERLCVWPWCPWAPWWSCNANLVFRATQNCRGQTAVIVDESIFQTRFDIPTQLNVNLVANDQACCLVQPCQDTDCPPGNCMLPIDICDYTSAQVGGNPGASAAPATVGYGNPGGATPGSPFGDRPFSEGVLLSATFGETFDGDYYEFEWTTTPSIPSSWQAMPLAADGGFERIYWDASLNPHGVSFNPVSPPINSSEGLRNVFESLQHYSANNPTGIGWDASNYYTLMWWLTDNTGLPNGTYYLRLKAWTRPGYSGNLTNPTIVPFCGEEEEANYVAITIENRLDPGPGAGHPTDHPCGSGTVHICTTEPDNNIFSLTIAGQSAGPCAIINAKDSDPVEISFMVHDSAGMLAYYALSCNYGLDQVVDVICSNNGVPTPSMGIEIGSITPGPAASFLTSWIGPAAEIGPDYGSALTQGATAPVWNGGTLTLTTTVGAIFPEPCPSACAYELQLWTYKRNVVECDYENYYYNLTELSLTVIKSEPC